ncbi:MAG: hypothetical protein HYW78_02440 [Parcubacteria group bacterium]|nr:hypothetical protein [Parcubacteria group bacterium]
MDTQLSQLSDQEKMKRLRNAFQAFLSEVHQLEREHNAVVQKILKEINERKIKEIKERLGL